MVEAERGILEEEEGRELELEDLGSQSCLVLERRRGSLFADDCLALLDVLCLGLSTPPEETMASPVKLIVGVGVGRTTGRC